MRILAVTIAKLETLGLGTLIKGLSSGIPIQHPIELPFGSLQTAKRVMALLYQFLHFYPNLKAKTTLRLNKDTGVLTIIPKAVTEKRGRKHLT